MEIASEFVDDANLDKTAIEQATKDLPAFPNPELVRIVLTGDLERSVSQRLARQDDDPAYEQERLTGVVGAKTLHTNDATEILVVAGPFLHGGRKAFDGLRMPRVIRHEGWHAVLHQRGEEVEDLWKQMDPDLPRSDSTLSGVAMVGLTETRIERTLWSQGESLPSRAGDTEEILRDLGSALGDAAMDQGPGDSVTRLLNDTLGAFSQLVTHCCYLVAEEPSERDAHLDAVSRPLWDRFVGEYWEDLVRVANDIPEAAQVTDPKQLAHRFSDSAPIFREWFAHVGFRYEERDGAPYLDPVRTDFGGG
jgi:hypothetical protein